MREKTLHDMKMRVAHLREDRGVVREERKNRATQVAIQRTTQCTLIRTLVREEEGKGGRGREGRRERGREREGERERVSKKRKRERGGGEERGREY